MSTRSSSVSSRSGLHTRQAELERVLQSVADGDSGAMAAFYDATHATVFALIARLVGSRSDAEEVTLDVYMQVWRRAPTYSSERGKVVSWLLTIARSRALDRIRARRAERSLSATEVDENLPTACDCDPLEAPSRAERCRLVHQALASLPGEQRRAVELAFFQGLSHGEIAERTGDPLGTVKTRVRLGMIKLREVLRPLEQLA